MARPRKKKLSEEIAVREVAWDSFGYLNTLPDPDRILEKLHLSAYETFRDVETDDQVTTVMGSRRAAVKGLQWDVLRGDATDKCFETVKEIFNGLDIDRFIDDCMVACGWGIAAIEPIWDASGDLWYPSALIAKPSRWFVFDTQNRPRFLTRHSPVEGEEVEPYKLLFARHCPSYDNPYGVKLLARSYWPVFFKRNAIKWGAKMIERAAITPLIAKVPPGTSEEEKNKILDTLQLLIQNAVGTMPKDSEIEKIGNENASRSSAIVSSFIDMMDAAISKIWLGQTLTTQMGDVGSYSAAKVHQGVKDERRDEDAKMIESTANQLIKHIVDFNFADSAYPKFKLEKPFSISQERATRDKTLWDMGVRFTPEYYQTEHGLDSDQFDITEPQAALFSSFSKPRFSDQEAIDALVEKITGPEMNDMVRPMLAPAMRVIRAAGSYEQAMENLAGAFPEMDGGKIEQALENAIFLSQAWGKLSAKAGK